MPNREEKTFYIDIPIHYHINSKNGSILFVNFLTGDNKKFYNIPHFIKKINTNTFSS